MITASDSKKPSDDVKKAHGSSVVELNAFKETVDGCSTTQYHEDNATTVKTKKARLVCLIFPLLAKSSIFQALESRRLSEVVLAIQMCITNLAIKVVLREESKMVK